ncbi:uncharacterized protein LOC122799199 [Protopterus annectens]|uniref:uncharacterized protein LOC122799199 n=1 Tax=Protopterus annectens TaxID=7888 RepID=UPI001CF9DDDD|nr:uncharacterized protein LOC122799199 [Protopterus annectens]XP_043924038.1 uncharacterized protein LOC122799199 [Protopterus annectens]
MSNDSASEKTSTVQEPVSTEEKWVTPLHLAAQGRIGELQEWLKASQKVDEVIEHTPFPEPVSLLMVASLAGQEEICSLLLNKGADARICSVSRQTALHFAAKSTVNIVKKLINANADPNANNCNGVTPLIIATFHNKLDNVKALLEADAGIRISDIRGQTALHYAVYKNDTDVLRTLASADRGFYLSQLHSLLRLAVLTSNYKIAQMLVDEGADVLQKDTVYQVTALELCFMKHNIAMREFAIRHLKSLSHIDHLCNLVKDFPQISDKYKPAAAMCLEKMCLETKVISSESREYIMCQLTDLIKTNVHETEHFIAAIYWLCSKPDKEFPRPLMENLCSTLMSVFAQLTSSCLPFAYGILVQLQQSQCGQQIVASLTIPEISEEVIAFSETLQETDLSKVLKSYHSRTDRKDETSAVPCQSEKAPFEQGSTAAGENATQIMNGMDNDTIPRPANREATPTSHNTQPSSIKNEEKVSLKKHKKKKTHKGNSASGVCGNTSSPQLVFDISNTPGTKRPWHSKSERWQEKLKELANLEDSKVIKLGSLNIACKKSFLIAKGSNDTEVYLGLRKDGTEVAVKRMPVSNFKFLKNECQCLRLSKLESPFIVNYMDFEEDNKFGYLALELCEYTLEEYLQIMPPAKINSKEILQQIFKGLKVLHSQGTKILHRDLKPQNVLIDVRGAARLADFGISRCIPQDQSILYTMVAGSKYWRAHETIEGTTSEGSAPYKTSSDIQVAGMLAYYVLSRGHHPFEDSTAGIEMNILDGKYSLDHVTDEVAKDLVERMISKSPKDRPKITQVLNHPYFWDKSKRLQYLVKVGNQEKIYKKTSSKKIEDPELLDLKSRETGRSFQDWKSKVPEQLRTLMRPLIYNDSTVGLLRFIRNLHEHRSEEAQTMEVFETFPDLFIQVYKFAETYKWNSHFTLKTFFEGE